MQYIYDKITLVSINVNRETYDEVAANFQPHDGCAQYIKTPMPVPIFDIAHKRVRLTVNTEQLLSKNGDTPKKTSFATVTQEMLGIVVFAIHQRFRKCLGWKSPAGVLRFV